MAEQQQVPEEDVDQEETPGYKPPAQVSAAELLEKDAEDESLQKYKQALGLTKDVIDTVFFPEDPRKVIMNTMTLLIEGRDNLVMDLKGDLQALKKKNFVVKQGSKYKIQFNFNVQRELVNGLKYFQTVHKSVLRVDKHKEMMGSFAPKKEEHQHITSEDTFPEGTMARGTYRIMSSLADDDKNEYLKFEWNIDIKKDWK